MQPTTARPRTSPSLAPAVLGLLAAAAAGAPSLAAQKWTQEKLPTLGIELRVSGDLAATPIDPGAQGRDAPYRKAQFLSEDVRNGFPADGNLRVLVFDKKTKLDQRRARNFEDFVKNHQHFKGDRTIKVEGEATKGRRRTPDHEYWEYYEVAELDGGAKAVFYHVGAVYDLGDREVALVYDIYEGGGTSERDIDRKAIRLGQQMVQSLVAIEQAGGPSLEKDRRARAAKTPERLAAAEAAYATIANLEGWDFTTTDDFIVLYSFESKSKARRALKEAEELGEFAATLRARFLEDFPPPKDAPLETYPVLRVCHDEETYGPFGDRQNPIGNYVPASGDAVVLNDPNGGMFMTEDGVRQGLAQALWFQFADERWPGAPLQRWWNLGTAAYYAQFEAKGRRLQHDVLTKPLFYVPVSDTSYRLESPKVLFEANFREDRNVPWSTFVTWDEGKFDGARPANNRAQAYTMVDFLARGPGTPGFDESWNSIWKQYPEVMAKTKSVNKTIDTVFSGVDFAALEAAWRTWVDQQL